MTELQWTLRSRSSRIQWGAACELGISDRPYRWARPADWATWSVSGSDSSGSQRDPAPRQLFAAPALHRSRLGPFADRVGHRVVLSPPDRGLSRRGGRTSRRDHDLSGARRVRG